MALIVFTYVCPSVLEIMTSLIFRSQNLAAKPLVWTEMDSNMLESYKNFQLTMRNGRKVPSLFLESTFGQETLKFPQENPTGSNEFFWPISQQYIQNAYKRCIYLFPFLYVPSYVFTLKPLMALKYSALYIFRRIFGAKNLKYVREFLCLTKAYCTPGFQTLLALVEQVWETGSLTELPSILSKSKNFMGDILLSNVAERDVSSKFPDFEVERPSLTEGNFALDKQSEIKKQLCNRNDVWEIDILHEQNICVSCMECCVDTESYFEHARLCLQTFYPQEDGLFACFRCYTDRMTLKDLLLHIYTGCLLNMRSHCTYCGDASPRCKCLGYNAMHRLISESAKNKDRPNADLLQPDNIGILLTYLELKRITNISSAMETGDYGHSLSTLADPLAFRSEDMIAYVKQVKDTIYFCTKHQSLEFGPHFRSMVASLGISEEIYIEGIFPDKWKDRMSIDLDRRVAFDKMDLQEFCIYCLDWDRSEYHMRKFHPSCFCAKGPFRTVNDLYAHYAQHKVERSCTLRNCGVSFENLRDFVGHYMSSHRDDPEVFKIKCDTLNPVEGCDAGFMRKGRQAIHNLVFHIHKPEDIDTFFTRTEILMSELDDDGCEQISDTVGVEGKNRSQGDNVNQGAQVDNDDNSDDDEHVDGVRSDNVDEDEKETKFSKKDQKEGDKTNKKGNKEYGVDEDDKGKYPCLAERCVKVGVKFDNQEALDRHISLTHKCLYPDCSFTSLEDAVLASHIQSHMKPVKGVQCKQCSIICVDNLQLQQHLQSVHNYMCYVCKSSTFLSKAALDEHVKSCTDAPFEVRRDFLDSNPEDTPLELLIDLISQSGLHIDNSSLQAIKSASIKQNRLLKNPELNSTETEVIFDLPIFPPDGSSSLAIPSGRLKSLPRFRPIDQSPMTNFLSMSHLIDELNGICIEFSSTEKTYCSLLLQQIDASAKMRMKSMLSGSQSLNSIRLETILDSARSLFFLINLKNIYIQASNLARPADESIVNYFSRLSHISRLASFHLESEKRQAWRDSNVKIQFLRQVSGQFRKSIEERENTLNCNFTPSELLKMYLNFRKEYTSDTEEVHNLYRVQNGTDGDKNVKMSNCGWTKKRQLNYKKGKVRMFNDNGPRERLRKPVEQTRSDMGDSRRGGGILNSQNDKNGEKRISKKTYDLFQKIGRQPDFKKYFCLKCSKAHLSRYCKKWPGPLSETICSRCNLYHPECQSWN